MTLQLKNLVSLEQDIAGKWRATVDIVDETNILKFQTKPTQQDVKDEIKKNIDNRVVTVDRELESIKNDISNYQLKITGLRARKADLEAIE